jgi:predicted transposase YbfD/YdcC
MGSDEVQRGALGEGFVFLDYLKGVEDPRQQGKVVYPLDEILLLCLLAVLAGAENISDIALFGKEKLNLLRRFLPFSSGTPEHDRIGEVLAMLKADVFQKCFVAWVSTITGISADIIAIDGKVMRRTYQKKGKKGAVHIVSAFSTARRLVLGQVKVAEKSNEITAIPNLLNMLEIEGAIITIDAMGCQREISKQIIDNKANYVLALKGNQGSLNEDIEIFAREQKTVDYNNTTVSQHETVDGDHGRIETRKYTVFHDIDWLQKRHNWPGLKGVIMVESKRELGDKIEQETRFYITSLTWVALQLGPVVRGHWGIENGLHWVLDMVFRDDECRVRKDNAPANIATIRHIAYNLARRAPGKASLRSKLKAAAWNDERLVSLVTA